MRLSIHYLLLSLLLLLGGISRDQQLFGVWIVAIVFTLMTVTVRRILLILSLPLIIMTGGLFIFIIDGIVLMLTAAVTRLNVSSFWWALLGVLVMSNTNIWIERGLRLVGWSRHDGGSQPNVVTRRSPSWWLRLIFLGFWLFGVAFSFAMATQVFLAASNLTSHMLTLASIASLAFALLVLGISWLVAEGLALDRRAQFSLTAAVLATIGLAIPTSTAILTFSPPQAVPLPEPRPDTRFWDLPTGSRIAYGHFPAVGDDTHRNPIIFIHDFGRAVLYTDIAFFRRFNDAGYDVYLYDQVGCGLSGRLPDIGEYTVIRHVEDLEAIRETVMADRFILIGHAGGAEIAARYMIRHRDRVERVVFYGPTPLWQDEHFVRDETRTAASPGGNLSSSQIPPVVALAIAAQSPRAAQAYVSQAEMMAWAHGTLDEGAMVCLGDRDLAPQPESPGYNPYARVIGEVTANRSNDPRPALSELLIPTILVRGECDPVDRDVVRQYQNAIPYLQVFDLPGAGSMAHISHPEEVAEIILTFLRTE